jgi:hypothetical protein
MTTISKAAVERKFQHLHEGDFSATTQVPAKAKAALKATYANRAGDSWDDAKFAQKRIGGTETYAALVPGVDWLDISVVNAGGKKLAIGTYDAGDTTASWS